MQDPDPIATFIATRGITKCPTVFLQPIPAAMSPAEERQRLEAMHTPSSEELVAQAWARLQAYRR
jgi:hypothetical protein